MIHLGEAVGLTALIASFASASPAGAAPEILQDETVVSQIVSLDIEDQNANAASPGPVDRDDDDDEDEDEDEDEE